MSFDQEPEDPHGECAAEIGRLLEEQKKDLADVDRFRAMARQHQDQRDEARVERDCHASALDGALVALAGSGICTPVEGFKKSPGGYLGTCIRNLRDERDHWKARALTMEETNQANLGFAIRDRDLLSEARRCLVNIAKHKITIDDDLLAQACLDKIGWSDP